MQDCCKNLKMMPPTSVPASMLIRRDTLNGSWWMRGKKSLVLCLVFSSIFRSKGGQSLGGTEEIGSWNVQFM